MAHGLCKIRQSHTVVSCQY